MKRIFLILLVALFFGKESKAQDYETGIGLRAGFYNGLTVKHFLSSKTAFEGILDTRWRGFGITGLFEIHNQAFDINRLNWYYGFGAHIGFWDGRYYRGWDNDENYTILGIDGILGIEYNFRLIPINLSLDWKPAINLTRSSGFMGDGGALSIRYIF